MNTTAFVHNQNTGYRSCEKCHGGEGVFQFRDFIGSLPEKQFIKFIHDDILPPGTTFGNHAHKSDAPFEEWYVCLAGHGVMTLDGQDYPMGPGDASVCRANGSHAVRNTGKEDMRLLVICASPVKG